MIAKGPGLEKTGVTVNKWAEFTVDTRHAGKAQIHVAALDADCNAVEVITKDNKDGTYSCRYMPKKNIKHTVIVSYGGVAVPNSPFRVSCLFHPCAAVDPCREFAMALLPYTLPARCLSHARLGSNSGHCPLPLEGGRELDSEG